MSHFTEVEQKGEEMHSSGINDEKRLLELSSQPANVAHNWSQLSPEQRAFVKNAMFLHYGPEFVIQFANAVERHQFKTGTVCVTGSNTLDFCGGADLKSRGYVVVRNSPRLRVWTHPSGHEIWEVPQGRAIPPQIPMPLPLPATAIELQQRKDVVQSTINSAFDMRDEILALRRQLEITVNEQEYRRRYEALQDLLARWSDLMDRLLQEAIDAFGTDYAGAGRIEEKRLKELVTWTNEATPSLMEGLPISK